MIAVIGAGAVGGVMGGALHRAGHAVTLVARGAHLDAIRARGLRVDTPDGSYVADVPVVASVAEISPERVILAVKTQDVAAAVEGLDPSVPILCATNGVEAERALLRTFDAVYGALVWMTASHLEPGVVGTFSSPPGLIDVGRVPGGDAEGWADLLRSGGFASVARPDILRWKYAKLLTNLGNAVQAACGGGAADVLAAARDEGRAALTAAGIAWVPDDELAARTRVIRVVSVRGLARPGGSTWQSLARGAGATEVPWLNGEISLLGRLHRVPTPVNDGLQRIAAEMARARAAPGSMSVEEVRRRVLGA